MCGLSAIISLNETLPDITKLRNMNDLIQHRGPDGEGIYEAGKVALGHRRLAIVDLRPDGDQPMFWKEQYVIVYNGEIYNYIEVGDELTRQGYTFDTRTDTEVILAAYDHWGSACVEKFNGMWAFVILDISKNEVFCSRDRLGIKPLYYRVDQEHLYIGSEIKQLLSASPIVNQNVLLEFLLSGATDQSDDTFFSEIRALGPAHNLIVDVSKGCFQTYRYYRIPEETACDLEDNDSIVEWSAEFERSIQYRMRADVRVGTCLSGGLDSSSVAAMAAKTSISLPNCEKLTAVTAVSSEQQFDESKFAKMVVDRWGLNWVTVEPSLQEFKKNIKEVVYTQEEPFGSPSIFMQYFVMKAAKEEGCKVMLDGQGGDETLLGYENYYPLVYLSILKRFGIIELIKSMVDTCKNNSNMSAIWIAKYAVANRFPRFRLWRYKRNARFIKKHLLNDVKAEFLFKTNEFQGDIFSMQRYELESSNLPALLRYEDRNSMRHSVEARLPFCDYQTMETSLKIPDHLKVRNGWTKYILRRAMKEMLPESVLWRKNKLGFNAPEATWIQGCQPVIDETILSSDLLQKICNRDRLKRDLGSMTLKQKWRLFNVAVWGDLYNCQLSES